MSSHVGDGAGFVGDLWLKGKCVRCPLVLVTMPGLLVFHAVYGEGSEMAGNWDVFAFPEVEQATVVVVNTGSGPVLGLLAVILNFVALVSGAFNHQKCSL